MLEASYINQARVHRGYHYPRSHETVVQCIKNFHKFEEKFGFAIKKDFDQYYCIAKTSKTTANEYLSFLRLYDLPFEVVKLDDNLIRSEQISLTVRVEESSFDSQLIRNFLKIQLSNSKVNLLMNSTVESGSFSERKKSYSIIYQTIDGNGELSSDFVINATYANINGILDKFNISTLPLHHQLTELVLVDAKDKSSIGITIMDGDYMSIMPFNLNGLSSLSNVVFTPHETSEEIFPLFSCNKLNSDWCSSKKLQVCNTCKFRPVSNFKNMIDSTKAYIPWISNVEFKKSLITTKTFIKNANDSRVSEVYFANDYTFLTILAGKVDTVFQIAEEIENKLVMISSHNKFI